VQPEFRTLQLVSGLIQDIWAGAQASYRHQK